MNTFPSSSAVVQSSTQYQIHYSCGFNSLVADALWDSGLCSVERFSRPQPSFSRRLELEGRAATFAVGQMTTTSLQWVWFSFDPSAIGSHCVDCANPLSLSLDSVPFRLLCAVVWPPVTYVHDQTGWLDFGFMRINITPRMIQRCITSVALKLTFSRV